MTILFSNDWNTPLLRFISLYSSRLDVHQMPLAGTEAPRLYIPSIQTWPLPICPLPTFPRSLFNLKHHSPSSVYFYHQSLCQLQVRHTYWDRIMSKLRWAHWCTFCDSVDHSHSSLVKESENGEFLGHLQKCQLLSFDSTHYLIIELSTSSHDSLSLETKRNETKCARCTAYKWAILINSVFYNKVKCTTYKSMGSRGDLFQHEGCNYTERAYSYHTISKWTKITIRVSIFPCFIAHNLSLESLGAPIHRYTFVLFKLQASSFNHHNQTPHLLLIFKL